MKNNVVKKLTVAILICIISCSGMGLSFVRAEEDPAISENKAATVKPYITSNEKRCEVGDRFRIKLKGTKAVSYKIKDETVASVNEKGKVKTKRAGSTKLTILGANGKKYTCRIYVYDTVRWKERLTVASKDSKTTAAIKAGDVPSSEYTARPGELVNFTTILYNRGTVKGLVRLKDSGVTNKLSYKEADCMLQKTVIKPLSKMIDDAYAAGQYKYSIIWGGGYRTYALQDRYWQRRQSADPGYGTDPYNNGGVICVPAVSSEHRTGYAIDFDATKKGFKWLEKNSYKYGFIKRYPGDKTSYTGVMDEEWHFTYVGKDIAATCYLEGLCLEEYYEKYVNVEYTPN